MLSNYLAEITALLEKIEAEEAGPIEQAAQRVAKSLQEDRLLHVFGPGAHSFIGAEEMMYRSGGLVQVDSILDGGYSMVSGALRSTAIERTPGYAQSILKQYPLQKDDVLIIVNAYGVNCGCVDAALYAREQGLTSIAVTSVSHARSLGPDHPARHPSKKNLYELADLVIDTRVPVGDAVLSVPGVSQKIGPVSTYANAFVLNAISIRAVEICVQAGYEPLVWKSGNAPGGDAANRQALARYTGRIKHL